MRIGAAVNIPNNSLASFLTAQATLGPLTVRRSFNTAASEVPTTIHSTAAAEDQDAGILSIWSFKTLDGPGAVAAGRHDTNLRTLLASFPTTQPSWVTCWHEPEDDIIKGTFTPAQFRAAIAHLHDLAQQVNPAIRVGVISMSYWWRPGTTFRAQPAQLWPGAGACDFLGIDDYNAATTTGRTTPATDPQFQGWYQWACQQGIPLLVTEYGRLGNPDDPWARAIELGEAHDWLTTAGFDAWLYWNATGGGHDWSLGTGPAAAEWHAIATQEATHPMTIFAIDLSHYQPNKCVGFAHAQGYSAIILKSSEGRTANNAAMITSGYSGLIPIPGDPHVLRDTTFPAKLTAARTLKFPVAAYHFVTMSSTVAQQVANIEGYVPKDIPVWLDVEAGATKAQAKAIGDAIRKAGWHVPGMYVGSRPPAGYAWWRAAYGRDPIGYGSVIYPGDSAPGWVGQVIWQYGQHGRLTGYTGDVDVNAIKGLTTAQLLRTGWFHVYTDPTPPPPPPDPIPIPPIIPDSPQEYDVNALVIKTELSYYSAAFTVDGWVAQAITGPWVSAAPLIAATPPIIKMTEEHLATQMTIVPLPGGPAASGVGLVADDAPTV